MSLFLAVAVGVLTSPDSFLAAFYILLYLYYKYAYS